MASSLHGAMLLFDVKISATRTQPRAELPATNMWTEEPRLVFL